MRSGKALLLALGLATLLWLPTLADSGQIYGKVYTRGGEEFQGMIRWDKNEAFWDDILDGNKELDRERRSDRSDRGDRGGRKSISIMGLKIYSDDGWSWTTDWPGAAQSGIRFGHIKTLLADDDRVSLVLKSGKEVEFESGSTDFGSGVREILVDDEGEGEVELYWDDIDKIEFSATPQRESKFGKRLYGTVTTRGGDTFTGAIAWDADEVFDTDILDGRDNRRTRKIEFGKIKSIERKSSQSSLITLKDGRELELEDSNDIDSGNRGIAVSDSHLGRIVINWDEFDMLTFQEPPAMPNYDQFDGGRTLRGTIITEDGDRFTGDIKWDDDEEYTWEILDGDFDDIEYDIEFGMVASIEKISSRSSRVTLKDGRIIKLKGSNDINSDNKGIIIKTADDNVEVDWEDFAKAEFAK